MLFLSSMLFAQEGQDSKNFSTVEIPVDFGNRQTQLITEVYGDYAQKLLTDPSLSRTFKLLLSERMHIKYLKYNPTEKYQILTSATLKNQYNKNLRHDDSFDKETFNPLKYNLELFSNLQKIYRIGTTDYLLVIDPQVIPNTKKI